MISNNYANKVLLKILYGFQDGLIRCPGLGMNFKKA